MRYALLLLALSALAQNPPDVKRGEELAKQKCDTCHTLRDPQGQPVFGLYAGGKVLVKVASSNLTPDPSGIPYFDEKLFLQALRTGQVGARKLAPVMNPALFKSFTDDDLRSIFAYLRALPPVKHRVDNTEPPTLCKICRQKHGGGDTN